MIANRKKNDFSVAVPVRQLVVILVPELVADEASDSFIQTIMMM